MAFFQLSRHGVRDPTCYISGLLSSSLSYWLLSELRVAFRAMGCAHRGMAGDCIHNYRLTELLNKPKVANVTPAVMMPMITNLSALAYRRMYTATGATKNLAALKITCLWNHKRLLDTHAHVHAHNIRGILDVAKVNCRCTYRVIHVEGNCGFCRGLRRLDAQRLNDGDEVHHAKRQRVPAHASCASASHISTCITKCIVQV
jgi:hypothetical protein